MIISSLIGTAIQCLVGYLFISYIPRWLNIKGVFATILKVIGVLIILRALIAWF